MLRYVVLRLLQGIVVVFLVSLATFGMMQLAPGSPVDILVGEAQITDEQIAAIEHKWGLDRPVHEQYLTWLGNVLTLDFGQSVIRTGVPVGQMLLEAAPMTIRLNLLALACAATLAIRARTAISPKARTATGIT
jgi:peptide/nickel transport system permease protein